MCGTCHSCLTAANNYCQPPDMNTFLSWGHNMYMIVYLYIYMYIFIHHHRVVAYTNKKMSGVNHFLLYIICIWIYTIFSVYLRPKPLMVYIFGVPTRCYRTPTIPVDSFGTVQSNGLQRTCPLTCPDMHNNYMYENYTGKPIKYDCFCTGWPLI